MRGKAKAQVNEEIPYPLVSRRGQLGNAIVRVGKVQVGGERVVLIAGPCAVEARDQLLEIALAVRDAGARVLRGGAFKPRDSPYSFQGLGEEGLEILAGVGKEAGMPVVTEALDPRDVELVASHADAVQVGSRNMQNYPLLEEVGRCGRPVLLKRGMSATLEEFLLAAEYVARQGNRRIVLCERGIRTFGRFSRNTLDLAAVPHLKRLTPLPVIVDPSHGTGARELVAPMARAALAAGADGLMIEVHPHPEHALSDGPQSLKPADFSELAGGLERVAGAVGRRL